MKARILRFGTAFGVALVAFVFLAVSVSLAAPTENADLNIGSVSSAARVGLPADGDSTGPVLHARRRISIPFGIDSSLALIEEGRAVLVTGPVDCNGGERYELRVMVRQQGKPTVVGHGATQGFCTASTWKATATPEGRAFFRAGDARVCGVVRVPDLDGRTATRHWCKDVELVTD